MSKEHGIAFTPDMLQAIRDGRKTMTRRIRPRQIAPGDRIWVKEALHRNDVKHRYRDVTLYEVDGEMVLWKEPGDMAEEVLWQWKRPVLPAMYMPKWAARTWLEVTVVRSEQVQAISEADSVAEGVQSIRQYAVLWDTLHTAPGTCWQDNPVVQVIEFIVVE